MIIPFAVQSPDRMPTRGAYTGGQGPRGIVVHCTAGRYENGIQSAFSTIKDGIKNNYTYLCISRDGYLVQAHDIMKWGYHAGESAWSQALPRWGFKILGGVSDDKIGIELCNAGKLTPYKGEYHPWWNFDKKGVFKGGRPIPTNEVAYVEEPEFGCPTGYYHKISDEQFKTLERTCIWLWENVLPLKRELVVGHHEVSGKIGLGYFRKSDPGGSFPTSMPAYRSYLINNSEAIKSRYDIKKNLNP